MGLASGLRELDGRDRMSAAGMGGFILVLHILGWGSLLILVAPNNYALGDAGVFGIGLGLTAYTLGMRHAFDADHIAAIDNVTRKLMIDRPDRRPLSVGFWFSLGHSSVVFLMCLLLGFGLRAIVGQVENDSSTLHAITGVVGTSVSGAFLLLIGLINLIVLAGILRVFRKMRTGQYDERELERRLDERGFANRLLRPLTKAVRRPWHMFPLGFLFGLGFDTATEISLLVLAGGAAALTLPWYAVLTLPILFAAGMSLLDTIDGGFMSFAYTWAFAKPVRRVFYNITVTALSVAVALLIGGIELLGLLAEKLEVSSGPLAWIASINLDFVGYGIVALFAVTWIGAIALWRFGRIEQRWSTPDAQLTSAD